MNTIFRTETILLIYLLTLFENASSSPQLNLLVELRSRHLAIPVPYKPHQYYSVGTPTIQLKPKPKSNNLPTSSQSVDKQRFDQVIQHGRSMMRGRSMGRPSNESDQVTNSTNNNNTIVNEKIVSHNTTEFDAPMVMMDVMPRMLAQMSVGGKYVAEPEDTDAQFGDSCNPTEALEWDYCEQAKYPNKGRMVCATVDLNETLAGTCVCKFAKIAPNTWAQMNYSEGAKLCRSPNGGVCYVKFHSGEHTKDKQPIYHRNITKAHDQCDDDEPLNSKNRRLLCSKPHPRRFSSYNAYHYYCLTKADRLPSSAYKLGVNLIVIILMLWIVHL